MITMDVRKQKAEQLVQAGKVQRLENKWIVQSQSGNGSYDVVYTGNGFRCGCPDFEARQKPCKHIEAVRILVLRVFDSNGKKVLEIKRPYYPQNWSAYNASQISEKELFLKLLADLCKEIEEPLYRFGRPKLSLSDMVFSSALKVYTTFSLRRFITDMKTASEKGYISHVCSYSSVSNYMRNEKLTTILKQLITLSSLPLKAVETKFAIDSTGLRTTKFTQYCEEKHEVGRKHEWIKLHICTGTKTNTITSVEIGNGHHSADTTQFIPLVQNTAMYGFDMREVSADKAYSTKNNLAYVDSIGAVPYIPFKVNSVRSYGGNSRVWRKMYDFYTYRRTIFLNHYHARSNVESTFFMMKAKFTDVIRSRDKTAQINEALLKCLCHNIVVLIQSMNEFEIDPKIII